MDVNRVVLYEEYVPLMRKIWLEIEEALDSDEKVLLQRCQPASIDDISRYEDELDCELPYDLKASLLVKDLTTAVPSLRTLGYSLSLEESMECWRKYKKGVKKSPIDAVKTSSSPVVVDRPKEEDHEAPEEVVVSPKRPTFLMKFMKDNDITESSLANFSMPPSSKRVKPNEDAVRTDNFIVDDNEYDMLDNYFFLTRCDQDEHKFAMIDLTFSFMIFLDFNDLSDNPSGFIFTRPSTAETSDAFVKYLSAVATCLKTNPPKKWKPPFPFMKKECFSIHDEHSDIVIQPDNDIEKACWAACRSTQAKK